MNNSNKAVRVSGISYGTGCEIPKEGTWVLNKGERVVVGDNRDLKKYLLQNSNAGKSKMQNNISKDFNNLILKYGFIAVKDYFKSKDKDKDNEPVINDRLIDDAKVKKTVNENLIEGEAQYKGLRIRLHNLYKEGRLEEETIRSFGKLISVLTISIEISGIIKSNPNAKLSAKYAQDVTECTVLGDFYNNALECAKSMIDELKAE